MDKMLQLRKHNLKAELRSKTSDEYIISMDVARSKAESNNQSAYVIGKIHRGKNGAILSVDLVNIVIPPNGLSFTEQTIILKKLQKSYKAQVVCVDTNGLGKQIAPIYSNIYSKFGEPTNVGCVA